MKLLPLKIPPGVVRPGTVYDAKGRWYDSNLVRWHEGALQPWGGWTSLAVTVAVVRGMLAWKRNNGQALIAVGSPSGLHVYTGTGLTAITPAGLAPGGANATGDFYNRVEATSWQLDAFGEDLVAVSSADQRLHYWNSSGAGAAAPLLNAPTCRAVVVTPERFIVALGANGDPREVGWCDQEDPTDWAPTVVNQAGSFPLTGNGQLMAGRRSRGETLIWTDIDLWAMRYVGGSLVYSFLVIGNQCGAISRHSMAVVDGRAIWMGARSFYGYDGFVQPIPSDVGDFVFNDLNRDQASKICAVVNSDFGEVTWYYPSAGSIENDRYVTYDYLDQSWAIGSLSRTSGIDRGFLQYPLLADAGGTIYEHEKGSNYSGATPYVESGPVELGDGDQVMYVGQVIPDEKGLGQVNTTFYGQFHPTGPETTFGPYTNANPTDVRFTCRQVRVRHTHVSGAWRVGTIRLGVVPGGRR